MKKLLSMVLAVVMILTMAVGCAKEEVKTEVTKETNADTTTNTTEETTETTEDIVLRVAWWGNPTRDERTEAALNLYTEQNPHVTFEMEPIGWSGYWDKLATQTASGSLPDIIQQDYAFIGQYIERGILADLTPFVSDGTLNLDNVSDSILKGGMKDTGLYGIPLGMNALAYVYNKELMSAAGINEINPDWSWADFDETTTKVFNDTGIRSDAPIWDDPKFALEYMLRQNDMTLYNADGTALGFENNAIVLDFFTRLQTQIAEGVYPKPEEFTSIKTMEESLFVTGKTLGGFIWSNFFVAYSGMMDQELELTVLPNENDASGLYLKPSQFFSVTEQSEYKEEAAKVVDFITNSIEANNILLAERGIPVASQVREGIKANVSAEVAKTFDYIALAENYATPIAPPEPVGAAEVTKIIKSLYEQVGYGVMSPEEAAEALVEEANAVLSSN